MPEGAEQCAPDVAYGLRFRQMLIEKEPPTSFDLACSSGPTMRPYWGYMMGQENTQLIILTKVAIYKFVRIEKIVLKHKFLAP